MSKDDKTYVALWAVAIILVIGLWGKYIVATVQQSCGG